jgi:hypothetical protein
MQLCDLADELLYVCLSFLTAQELSCFAMSCSRGVYITELDPRLWRFHCIQASLKFPNRPHLARCWRDKYVDHFYKYCCGCRKRTTMACLVVCASCEAKFCAPTISVPGNKPIDTKARDPLNTCAFRCQACGQFTCLTCAGRMATLRQALVKKNDPEDSLLDFLGRQPLHKDPPTLSSSLRAVPKEISYVCAWSRCTSRSVLPVEIRRMPAPLSLLSSEDDDDI